MTTTAGRIADFVERGIGAGTSMLDSLARNPMVRARIPKFGTCSCEIPAPCWMPREHGPVTTHVCAGSTATLRLRVTNCSIERSTIEVQAAGPDAAQVEIDPRTLALGPLERGVVSLSFATDAKAASGGEHEILVWIRGCVDHVVRWTVRISSRGGSCCHELDLDDCPDYVHHWYDHFYCARPCAHHGQR